LNRYEINQKVKTSLVRNAVDLTQISYSCSGSTVHLWGILKKDPEGDFTPNNVELLFREISRLPQVRRLQVDLENWEIQKSDGGWAATPLKKTKQEEEARARARRSGAGEDKTLVVDRQEGISEVLDDIKKRIKEKSS
jgi:hypothetical protein